ncbi:MAG: DUF1932 domain-containing protein [Janthinobacterium lividum]
MPVIAVIAAGAMGSAVGRVLVEHGAEVRTLLAGRSPASVARAAASGMRSVDMAGIAGADVILSIVPPGDAVSLSEQLAPALRHAKPGLIYADCNAVSPQTVQRVEAAVAPGGVRFVDAGIIGGPPKPGSAGPVFYASGEHAAGLTLLAQHGLTVKLLDGPVGAASGLKMSYAGITKGLTALAAAMMLSATRFGAASDLAAELAESQPELLALFRRQVPGMYPKAYRWVAEMQEIAAFAGEDAGVKQIYTGMAALYQDLAADQAGSRHSISALDAFLGKA